MATKAEVNALYAAGLIQGIAPGHVPGGEHDLHQPQSVWPVQHPVRAMFLPQVITAVTSSLGSRGYRVA